MNKDELREVNTRRLNGECDLCGGRSKGTKFEGHHLTYNPDELVVSLCFKCHDALHTLANLTHEQLDFVVEIVKRYGKNWKKKRAKYNKTDWERVVTVMNTERNLPNIQATRRGKYADDAEYRERVLERNRLAYRRRKGIVDEGVPGEYTE